MHTTSETAEVAPVAVSSPKEARMDYVEPGSIIIPQLLLRQAQTDDEGYAVLRNSIREHGQRMPVLVAPGTEPGTYILSDGMQRLSVIKELGIPTVLVRIEDLDEAELVESQMESNLARVNVPLSQYSRLLTKYAQKFPTKTKAELARRLGVTPGFLDDRLNFTRLCPEIQQLCDESTIGLSKAVLLASLDHDTQKEFIERAGTLQIDQFAKAVSARKSELAKARNEGRAPKAEEFIPTAGQRSKVEIIAESDALKYGMVACQGLTTPIEGYATALKWVLRLDPASIADGQAKWDAAKKASDERKQRAKEERERKQREASAAVDTSIRG